MTVHPPTKIEFLIVGAGPAGASLACFLARYGITGLVISAAPGTADTPRAHCTNQAALDCLRDIGLWEECKLLGQDAEVCSHMRWSESLVGEEYARVHSWGAKPDRMGDFATASPCRYLDLPQTLLEPLLVKYATHNGFKVSITGTNLPNYELMIITQVRFDTQLLGFERDPTSGTYVCSLKDRVSGAEYAIATKYLFGADGGRSLVADTLKLPFTSVPGGALAYNILVKADLTHLMKHRKGQLNTLLGLRRDYPFISIARMVKPWHEWMWIAFPKGPDVVIPGYTFEEWKQIIRDQIGDDSVDVEVVRVDKWLVNEKSADIISDGNALVRLGGHAYRC
jgi:2-polyprenyl-6-methoxyphenol hydroxylase-like FAD-dependent oxidoreductase